MRESGKGNYGKAGAFWWGNQKAMKKSVNEQRKITTVTVPIQAKTGGRLTRGKRAE